MPASIMRDGYRFHRPTEHDDLEVVHGQRVQRQLDLHLHAKYEIVAIAEGGARFEVRGVPVHVSGGSVLVVNAGDPHAVASDDGGCSFSLLYVPAERMASAADQAGHGAIPPVFAPCAVHDPGLAGIVLRLNGALERDAPAAEVEDLLESVLVGLLARAHVQPVSCGPRNDGVARARRYIDEHYAEPIAIDDLAALAGLSKYHFIRVFREAHGMPPHACQNAVRIARAREALAAGRTAADVAQATGYADQSHFTRRFKRLVGVAPGEYARWCAAHARRARAEETAPA